MVHGNIRLSVWHGTLRFASRHPWAKTKVWCNVDISSLPVLPVEVHAVHWNTQYWQGLAISCDRLAIAVVCAMPWPLMADPFPYILITSRPAQRVHRMSSEKQTLYGPCWGMGHRRNIWRKMGTIYQPEQILTTLLSVSDQKYIVRPIFQSVTLVKL